MWIYSFSALWSPVLKAHNYLLKSYHLLKQSCPSVNSCTQTPGHFNVEETLYPWAQRSGTFLPVRQTFTECFQNNTWSLFRNGSWLTSLVGCWTHWTKHEARDQGLEENAETSLAGQAFISKFLNLLQVCFEGCSPPPPILLPPPPVTNNKKRGGKPTALVPQELPKHHQGQSITSTRAATNHCKSGPICQAVRSLGDDVSGTISYSNLRT